MTMQLAICHPVELLRSRVP